MEIKAIYIKRTIFGITLIVIMADAKEGFYMRFCGKSFFLASHLFLSTECVEVGMGIISISGKNL